MHSERNELHRSSRAGFFCTWVDRRGGDGVGCEGSTAGFLVDVTGRSSITDWLEHSGDADSDAGTGGTGTGVEAVVTGDSCFQEWGWTKGRSTRGYASLRSTGMWASPGLDWDGPLSPACCPFLPVLG